ncbi:hypothetical protein BpHYR1_016011 [Brachionus plicatilis]|uniref:Uncharacterized protein n=1 Tax=Brachionus plicatilis TaxID=10195 RepID=A0A3M7Q1F3_BRAPC|nr:hypothetical protein BpHYR1_016011 [Brachionus plicatilis]
MVFQNWSLKVLWANLGYYIIEICWLIQSINSNSIKEVFKSMILEIRGQETWIFLGLLNNSVLDK